MGIPNKPSVLDWIMHILSLPFKVRCKPYCSDLLISYSYWKYLVSLLLAISKYILCKLHLKFIVYGIHLDIQRNLLITAIQGTGQKWPLCTCDRYRQVDYYIGRFVGTN